MTVTTALITGAGQGIGRAVALRLAQAGLHTLLVGRTAAKLHAVAAEVTAAGGRATVLPADLADSDQISRLAQQVAQHGRLDMLIYCAGESFIRPLPDTTATDLARVLAINLVAPCLTTQALLPLLKHSPNASIIYLVSKVALRGWANVTAYTAAKTGLLGFARSLAAELTPEEIRVVPLCPGPVDTPMRHAATPQFDPATIIQPHTVADLVAYLVALPRGTTAGDILLQSMHYE
ncbi:MAG: SDR family oxidoreductase [Anaerolineae bacterium]|nr:SDR family oxidoreductase [Anaerolineae bacterium]